MEPSISAKNALLSVLEAAPGEQIVIVCDEHLRPVGDAFAHGAVDMGLWTRLVILKTEGMVRKDIPSHLYEIFNTQRPDIFINLLRGSSEETPFRIKVTKMETRRRVRLGHCPGITLEMLTHGALALSLEEYRKMQSSADRLLMHLQNVDKVQITAPGGTDVTFAVKGRAFFTDTKIDWQSMKWMNLPVGEVLCGPIEDSANGVLVADMAVGGIGQIESPVEIRFSRGSAESITCADKDVEKKILDATGIDDWGRKIGEFAFGINPSARITEEFLETEKIHRTCHIALGNNEDFPGGKNSSQNHMDFLFNNPTVTLKYVDGHEYTIMENGELKL
ncbi:MAG: aminopeptidase [Candidatus Thermoplasmatota archaeon]|nr:aminopeptidase [Candidatus Thermoplasmatota archaeon]